MHRSFKKFCDVRGVMEVYQAKDEVAVSWEEAEIAPDAQTQYRALAARLKSLAADRADLLSASKECPRRMSKPCNKDWEPL